MSKFIAEKTFRMTNENNDLVISYVVHGLEKDAALLAYEETRNSEKKLEVEVKPYRSKRSLEQNKLLWVLLGKLAMAMSGKKNKVSSEEAYAIMLEEANVSYDYLLALPEAEPMLCTNFTENQCHNKFDFGTREEREEIGAKIEAYLKSKYPNWDKENLIYRR